MNRLTIKEKLALVSIVPLTLMLLVLIALIFGETSSRNADSQQRMQQEANNLAQVLSSSINELSSSQIQQLNSSLTHSQIQAKSSSTYNQVIEQQGQYQLLVPINNQWQLVLKQPQQTLQTVAASHSTTLAFLILLLVASLGLTASISRYIVRTLTQMRLVTDQACGNDLTVRLNYPEGRDDLRGLGNHIDNLIATRQRVVKSLLEVCRKLQEQADVLLNNASNSNQLSIDQRQHLDSLATAMEEMTVTVSDVTNHAEDTSKETQNASRDAEKGLSQIHTTIGTIEQLVNDVQSAANAVSQVNVNAAKIDAVVATINGISEQTNLLALNAAIEAARAGHHGRGFAVVADEVRSLASRTQSATVEIQQMIEELQSGTSNLESLMHSTTNRAEQGQQLISLTGEGLQQIASHSEKIFNMNDHIATAAGQQSGVMNDISGNLLRIRNQSHDAEQAANDSVSASQNVGTIAGDLAAQLSRLKI
ncbi:methyl-accepting chemotaxis protein [Shewanella gelidii]|uniref:Chemotaxis protein n=1 Tax=Shewanella gelidii TaxID=1642821 RepID=A0A917N798_9GAMM|nr:methyl-accepting chemotaxis protein [Shewanella gelidii]MCL1097278.1 methyl-accepting chemotaxis protein [Shewanella gelidii]GGI73864.1 chemotaxis protein [Shewanella gelidii]